MKQSSKIDVNEEAGSTRFALIYTGVSLFVFLVFWYVLPNLFGKSAEFPLVFGLAGIFMICGCAQIYYYGPVVVSSKFQGKGRVLIQIFLALLTPIILSQYFLVDGQDLKFISIFEYWTSPWSLLVVGILGVVVWISIDFVDKEFPIRAYLIISAACFVISIMGYHDVSLSNSIEDTYNDVSNYDKIHAYRRSSGYYFGRFFGEIIIFYTILTIGILKRRKTIKDFLRIYGGDR